MSVQLTSKDGTIGESISNGSFAALVAMARAFGEDVPEWNGCHDGQEYTAAHLNLILARLIQLEDLKEILVDLSRGGGAVIS